MFLKKREFNYTDSSKHRIGYMLSFPGFTYAYYSSHLVKNSDLYYKESSRDQSWNFLNCLLVIEYQEEFKPRSKRLNYLLHIRSNKTKKELKLGVS